MPLAYFYAWARVLRIVDGPDAVHRRSVARQELRREPPHVGLSVPVECAGRYARLEYGFGRRRPAAAAYHMTVR